MVRNVMMVIVQHVFHPDQRIIIIISLSHFYSAYILEQFNLRDATNKIIWLVIHGDREKLSLKHGTAEHL